MNLAEFVNKYIKTKVDFDKVWGAQCVDLFRQYCKDVLGIPHTGSVDGAKDLFLKYYQLPKEQEHFFRIVTSNPLPGDVCVFGATTTNQFGHVAICLGSTEKDVLIFEQDGFKQDGAKISFTKKDNLLGVLRFRRK